MKYFTVRDTAELLSLSNGTVYKLIKNGKLHAEWISKKEMRIAEKEIIKFRCNHTPKEDIEDQVLYYNTPSYLTIEQAGKELNLKPATIRGYIRSSMLPNAFKHFKNKWFIPKEDIDNIKAKNKIPPNYLSIEDTAKKISKHPDIIKKYIRDGVFFQNRIIIKRRSYIPLTDIIDYESMIKVPEGFITVQDVCKKLNKDDSSILPLIHNGEFPNAYFNKFHKRYLIPQIELADYIHRLTTFKDYISIKKCSQILSCTEKEILQMIKNSTLKFTKKNSKGETFISKKELNNFLNLQKSSADFLTLEQASNELEMPKKTLLELIENKKLDVSSFSHTNSDELNLNINFLIPKTTIAHIKDGKQKNFSTVAIELYNKKIAPLHYKKDLKDTVNLYNKFVLLKISQTRGQEESFTDKARSLFNTLNSIILKLSTGITLLTDKEIEEVLKTKNIPLTHKHNFIHFLSYCSSKIKCIFKNTYKVEYNETLRRDKEIYDKQTFLEFYAYVNNTKSHFLTARSNKQYAQTWLFIIMHMINGWRKSTIVTMLPNLLLEEIEGLNIYNLEHLKDKSLSINQAQSIINYYYLVCKNLHISKTDSLGQFLCNEDMVIPTATALLICELHRRNSQKQKSLLGSLNQYTNSHTRFSTFFNKNNKLPSFNSLVMNRSLLTHFFYTVTHYGKHSEISHELTKNLRNHRNINSITAYVQSTNCDGTLDSVSLNLFNRGTFGWLYNFIIDLAMDNVTKNTALENRTSIIQAFKNEYSPSQLEDISFLLLKYQNERESIVDKLMQLSKDQVLEIIIKILKGEKPSKTKHVQCITYPQCPFPNLDSCLNCPNAVLNTYLLINIVEELKNVHISIKNTEFDTIRYRDTLRFFVILDVINQAISEFGKSYIETFINFKA
ncbi:helix-turn-helix domain-containing protein, partial [Bacillus thuringiensis]|nr:helix-turn-helix domain-containing protein [Bacillus thuringiensis]